MTKDNQFINYIAEEFIDDYYDPEIGTDCSIDSFLSRCLNERANCSRCIYNDVHARLVHSSYCIPWSMENQLV